MFFFLFLFISQYLTAGQGTYPVSIAYITTRRDSTHFTRIHFADITAQRNGNILPATHPATSFFVNESFVKSNPLLTQALVNLREEYATTAFAKSCHGFSLVEKLLGR